MRVIVAEVCTCVSDRLSLVFDGFRFLPFGGAQAWLGRDLSSEELG